LWIWGSPVQAGASVPRKSMAYRRRVRRLGHTAYHPPTTISSYQTIEGDGRGSFRAILRPREVSEMGLDDFARSPRLRSAERVDGRGRDSPSTPVSPSCATQARASSICWVSSTPFGESAIRRSLASSLRTCRRLAWTASCARTPSSSRLCDVLSWVRLPVTRAAAIRSDPHMILLMASTWSAVPSSRQRAWSLASPRRLSVVGIKPLSNPLPAVALSDAVSTRD
jgi:hypothetical protein